MVLNGVQAAGLVLEGDKVSVNAVNKLYKKEVFKDISFPWESFQRMLL